MNTKENIALDLLKSKCIDIQTKEEGEILISLLDSSLREFHGRYFGLSAPEINVRKKVSIIRLPDFSLNLINPTILKVKNKVLSFSEICPSFPLHTYNCFRYEEIVIVNDFEKKEITLNGQLAFVVQHEIDHLNGILVQDRTIGLSIVRESGIIKEKDYCPCGSRERFVRCCMKK